MGSMRLDMRLVEDGLVPTRARARALILRGFVTVDGAVCRKPSRGVGGEVRVALAEAAPRYVSRGAEKLIAALDHFKFDAADLTILDAGASTGGFTQALLMRGARKVIAVDVGQSQLHEDLRGDPRVVSIEKCDVRSLTEQTLGGPVDAIVADLSFIALGKVVPQLLPLARQGAWCVALVKPQFELGPEEIGKGGIVRSVAARQRAVQLVSECVSAVRGWRVLGVIASPILGGSGNEEFLIGAKRDG